MGTMESRTRDDQDRRSDLVRAIDGREAVLKEHPHRQQRVVIPADLSQRREGQSQDERHRRVLDGEADSDGCPERLAEIHDAGPIDIRPAEEIATRSPSVGSQTLLARSSGVATVAAIVGEENLESVLTERRCQQRTVATVAGVAVENEDRAARGRSTSGDEPGVETQSVGGIEGDRSTSVGPA